MKRQNPILQSLQLLPNHLKTKGLSATLLIALSIIGEFYFDWKYKTNTCSWVALDDMGIDDNKKEHAVLYQPTRVIPLRKLFQKLKIPPGKVLLDLGCGKGRVLLVASEFGFKETRGIEFSSPLCDIAEKNIITYKAKTQTKTKFVVIHADIADHQFSDDEEVFFLFNPADDYVLEKVVENIRESLQRRDRRIWIIYRYAIHKKVFQKGMNIKKNIEFDIWGNDFVVIEI